MPISHNNRAFSPFAISIAKQSAAFAASCFFFVKRKRNEKEKENTCPQSHVYFVCKLAPSLSANYGNYVMNTYE